MAGTTPIVVLITGTSTGVGFATAISFASDPDRKYKVYATMRHVESKKDELEKAAGESLNTTLIIKELDVGDESSRVKCVEEILKEEKKIDILINNAVLSHAGLFETLDLEKDGQEKFNINYFGPLRLMQLVIPGMKERRSGKIFNISSIGTLLPNPFLDLYVHPKRALEAASESVAVLLREFNVWVSVLQLGAVMTPRGAQVVSAFDAYKDAFLNPDFIKDETTKKQYAKHMTLLVDLFKDERCQSNEEVSKFIKETAEIDKPVLYYQSSEFARKIAATCYVDPTGEERVKLFEKTVLSLPK